MRVRTLAALLISGGLSVATLLHALSPETSRRTTGGDIYAEANRLTLTVIVSGVNTGGGRLGAAVFTTAAGFPDAPVPNSLVHPHTSAPVDTFEFRGLAPGRLAVAVQHDLNGNGVVDRNLVGIPKEPWGVTRDIRHSLRAPRFEEAAFEFRTDTTVTVRVAR